MNIFGIQRRKKKKKVSPREKEELTTPLKCESVYEDISNRKLAGV